MGDTNVKVERMKNKKIVRQYGIGNRNYWGYSFLKRTTWLFVKHFPRKLFMWKSSGGKRNQTDFILK